ncbi:MAG: hypothetical protein Q9163_003206 [Psora crenata]
MALTGVNTYVPICQTVLAGDVAKILLNEISVDLSKLSKKPSLVGFLANHDPAARKYAEWTQRTCQANGVVYELREVEREELETYLLSANEDDNFDGIIVYYPIFNGRQDQYLQQIPGMAKDVEGLSHNYIFRLYHNERYLDEAQTQKSILPCTPLAILKILDYIGVYNKILPYGNRLFGRTITVINRSETVGRPLAALLANDGACVYSIDITGVQQFTRGAGINKKMHEVVDKVGWDLAGCLQISDVVISGVPGDAFKVPIHHVKDGAVCVNFSSDKNFPANINEKASIYVPSIGKVTIAILLRNLVRLVQNKVTVQAT